MDGDDLGPSLLEKPQHLQEKADYEERMQVIARKNLLRISALALFGIGFGYYIAIFNPMGEPVLKDVYGFEPNVRKQYIGNINMLFSIGALVAALVSGPISEKIGRRKLLIIFDVASVGMALLYSYQNIWVLHFNRFLSGFLGSGVSMISTILISELLPKKISGIGNVALFSFFTFCVFIAYIQQNIWSRETLVTHWQYILSWPAIPLAIKACLVPFLIKVESPKYIVKESFDDPDLQSKLESVYKETYRESQVADMTSSTIKIYSEQRQSVKDGGSAGGNQSLAVFKLLFTPLMKRRTVTGLILAFCNQLTGIGYFAFYSTDLFDRISGNGKKVTLFIALSKVVGGLVAVVFIKNFGRKFNMMFGVVLQAISIFAILTGAITGQGWIAFVAVMVYMVAYAFGIGGVFNAYLAETLPPTGVSMGSALNWTFNAIIAKTLPILAAPVGDQNLLLGFGILCTIHVFLIDWRVLETKDKSEETVIQEFKTTKYRLFNFR